MFSLADEACALAGSSFNTFPHLEKALALYNTTSGVKPWWLAPTRDKLRANGLLEDSERWAVSLPDHWPILRARASVASVRTGKVGPAVCLQLEDADGGDTEEHLRLGLRVSAARPLLLASGFAFFPRVPAAIVRTGWLLQEYDPLHNRSFTHVFLLAAFHSESIGVPQLSASVPLLESLSMKL